MSSSSESLTQKWLRQNIQLYAQADTVYSHVDAALARFPAIRPKTDVYTYDDGRTQLLLCLHGLLPISYRGAAYNIPIAVWLTREYPRLPPIAYVVPTNDMLVRASARMEVSGRCQIEYLLHWERKHEGCNLAALLEAMQEHFSREPPVYAKPPGDAAPHPGPQAGPTRAETTGPDYAGRPPPPLPGSLSSPTPLSQPPPMARGPSSDRPPLPTKPGTSSTAILRAVSPAAAVPPLGLGARTQSPRLAGSPSYASRPPPPLPAPNPVETGLPQYRQASMPPRYVQHEHAPSGAPASGVRPPPINTASHPAGGSDPSAHGEPPNAQGGPPSAYGGPPPPRASTLPPVALPVPDPRAYSSPPPPPPPPPPVSPTRITQPHPQTHHASMPPPFLTQHGGAPQGYTPPPPLPSAPWAAPLPLSPPPPTIPPPDIMDADDDMTAAQAPAAAAPAPAPRRPPNPELVQLHAAVHARLVAESASLAAATARDAERLRAHQGALLAGEPALRDEMARLAAVRAVCAGVAARVGAVVAEAERVVAELRRKGDPDVDELVCSTTIVHNQLINLVAEDNAIEDTMYHLHRALNTGRIDLERFLRTTRVLAEEQFMKRALVEKILGALPLGAAWS